MDFLFRTEQHLGFPQFLKFLNRAHTLQPPHETASPSRQPHSPIPPSTRKLTVPVPFSFTDAKPTESITKQKFNRMLEDKEREVQAFRQWKFRANPVPSECLVPMLHSLDAERANRKQKFLEQKATKN